MSKTPSATPIEENEMWYFAWILGLPLAAGFAVLNAMWLEMDEDRRLIRGDDPRPPRRKG